jgi:hypothetical protein
VIHRELTKVEGSRRRSHEKGQAEYIEYFLGAVPAPFIRITPISPRDWHGPSQTTPSRSEVGQSPGLT